MPKKTKQYQHLSQKERDLTAILKAEGQSLRAIARRLRRDVGTISRELKRNAPPVHTGYYLPHKVQVRARERKRAVHRRPRLKTASYFCEPYRSWEKGAVENTVGLVRRFLPKGTDFAKVAPRDIRRIERWLNHRPRKCLNYQTPAEAFRVECRT